MAYNDVELLRDARGQIIPQAYNPVTGVFEPITGQEGNMQIASVQRKWRGDFNGTALNADKWEVVATGAGQTISVTNGELVIAMGTTANAETILRSRLVFTAAALMKIGMRISQRIANNEIFLEAISVDKSGVPDGKNKMAWVFTGTTTNLANYEVQSGGGPVLRSGNLTVINPTSTNYMYEMEMFGDEVYWNNRFLDNPTQRSYSYLRNSSMPDPESQYRFQIRVRNGAAAPASSTSVVFQFVSILDHSELQAEITGGRGGATAGQAIPTWLTNTQLPVRQQLDNFFLSNTPLAASATFTSGIVDHSNVRSTLRIMGYSDQAGTLYVDQSFDTNAANFRQTHSFAATAGAALTAEIPVFNRFMRVRWVNGATAQTVFRLDGVWVPI